MGSLSWDQVRGIISNSLYWFAIEDPSYLARCEYVLKLYASLTPDQKRMLGQGLQITMSALKPEQQYAFMQAWEVKERPTFANAQDPDWAQTATFSLADESFDDVTLYAAADMCSLGGIPLALNIPYNVVDSAPQTSEEQLKKTVDRLVEEQTPKAAKELADQIAKLYPNIPSKSIGIYAERTLAFRLSLRGRGIGKPLQYSVRIDR